MPDDVIDAHLKLELYFQEHSESLLGIPNGEKRLPVQRCVPAFDVLRLQETHTCELESTSKPDIRRGEESCHRESHTKPSLS